MAEVDVVALWDPFVLQAQVHLFIVQSRLRLTLSLMTVHALTPGNLPLCRHYPYLSQPLFFVILSVGPLPPSVGLPTYSLPKFDPP